MSPGHSKRAGTGESSTSCWRTSRRGRSPASSWGCTVSRSSRSRASVRRTCASRRCPAAHGPMSCWTAWAGNVNGWVPVDGMVLSPGKTTIRMRAKFSADAPFDEFHLSAWVDTGHGADDEDTWTKSRLVRRDAPSPDPDPDPDPSADPSPDPSTDPDPEPSAAPGPEPSAAPEPSTGPDPEPSTGPGASASPLPTPEPTGSDSAPPRRCRSDRRRGVRRGGLRQYVRYGGRCRGRRARPYGERRHDEVGPRRGRDADRPGSRSRRRRTPGQEAARPRVTSPGAALPNTPSRPSPGSTASAPAPAEDMQPLGRGGPRPTGPGGWPGPEDRPSPDMRWRVGRQRLGTDPRGRPSPAGQRRSAAP